MTDLNLVETKNQVDLQLANKEVFSMLVQTVFKGLSEPLVKKAIMEGIIRGFTFKDFLEKNIYAIPFSGGYSLVTSIDHARKVGMRSGVVGKNAPEFAFNNEDKIISCTVTIKKKFNAYVGDFTATVYFSEYYKAGRGNYPSLWDTKPKTMIAKVAEMHALRMACPEELSQSYIEEEFESENRQKQELDYTEYEVKINNSKTMDELKTIWSALPAEAKTKLEETKNKVKENLSKESNENS